MVASVSTEIFRRVIEPEVGSISPDLAKLILELDFRGADHERYEALSSKAQLGSLTSSEAEELDGYLHVDSLLAIMRTKALRSLDALHGQH